MISYKKYELASGRSVFSEEKKMRADAFVTAKITQLDVWANKHLNRAKLFFRTLPDKTHRVLHRAWVFISTRVDKYFEKIRRGRPGSGSTGNKGAVSLYWREQAKIRDAEDEKK